MNAARIPKHRAVLVSLLFGGWLAMTATPAKCGAVYWSDGNGRDIQRMDAIGGPVQSLASGLKSPRGIAVDATNGFLYWTQATPGSITRGRLDGSAAVQLVTTGLLNPVGLALDVAGGKMYWTDTFTHKVQRANLNGTNVEDLVDTGDFNPRGIALDLVNDKIYWAEVSTSRIRRANLDGSEAEVIPIEPTDRFGALSVALDVPGGKLYWANSAHDMIQRANLDGSSVETLVQTGGDPYAIALDLVAGKMYWSGGAAPGALRRANLDGTEIEVIVVDQSAGIHGIALDTSVVPEPASIALAATAVIFMVAVRPRSRCRQAGHVPRA